MLYIANTTQQRQLLAFRVPGRNKVAYHEIPSGQQIEIGKDMTDADRDLVIQHLDRYGARKLSESTPKSFAGLVYSTSRPVKADTIVESHDVVAAAQQKRSIDELQKTALVVDAKARDAKTRTRRARRTDFTITRVGAPNDDTARGVTMNVSVDPEGQDAPSA